MKIDLTTISAEEFIISPHLIANETCWLIHPQHIGCSWTQENKHLRSSVWNSNGELISAGFPKFVNWGEKPEHFPVPASLKGCVIVDKLDGSLLVVSKYKGEFIIRTRGTVDASKMEKNGHEVAGFKTTILNKLERFFESAGDTWDFSVLFEWTSPLQRIVLDYGDKPLFKLIGWIQHEDYTLATQSDLDELADIIGLDRPETFTFDSTDKLFAEVTKWVGREGVCIYSNRGQTIHKFKAEAYLICHRFKSNASLESVIDIFVEYGYPSYVEFETRLTQQFDHECFSLVRNFASLVVDAFKTVKEIETGMVRFVSGLSHDKKDRGDSARAILSAYGETNRKSFCFNLLDGKQFGPDEYKKLLWQVLKK